MRNRNKEFDYDENMGFDYEAYDSERNVGGGEYSEYYDAEDSYPFDVEVVESVKKVVTVYASSSTEARQIVNDQLNSIPMESGIDEYKKYISGCYKRELML